MEGIKDKLSPHFKTWGDTSPPSPQDLRPCQENSVSNIIVHMDIVHHCHFVCKMYFYMFTYDDVYNTLDPTLCAIPGELLY